jgi:hypothetical protein
LEFITISFINEKFLVSSSIVATFYLLQTLLPKEKPIWNWNFKKTMLSSLCSIKKAQKGIKSFRWQATRYTPQQVQSISEVAIKLVPSYNLKIFFNHHFDTNQK